MYGTVDLFRWVLLRTALAAVLLGTVVNVRAAGGLVTFSGDGYRGSTHYTWYIEIRGAAVGANWQYRGYSTAGSNGPGIKLDSTTAGGLDGYLSAYSLPSSWTTPPVTAGTGMHSLHVGWLWWGGSSTEMEVPFYMDAATQTVSAGPEQVTNHYSFILKNNTNEARSVALKVGTTTVRTLELGGLQTQTFTGDVSGVVGTTVSLDPAPVWDGQYDPQMLLSLGGTITREGHYGGPAVLREVFLTAVSYALASPSIELKLDGQHIGTVTPTASPDGRTGIVTNYHWSLELSPDSNLTFSTIAPHTCTAPVADYRGNVNWIFVRELDRGMFEGQTSAAYSVNQTTGAVTVTQQFASGGSSVAGGNVPPSEGGTNPADGVSGDGSTPNNQTTGWTETNATTQETALDKDTFREGVDRIWSAEEDIKAQLSDLKGTQQEANGKLSEIAENTRETADNTGLIAEKIEQREQQEETARQTLAQQAANVEVQAAMDQAESWGNSAMSQAMQGRGTMTAPSVPAGGEMDLTVNVGDIGTQQAQVDMNPFNNMPDWLSWLLAWIKAFIGWATVGALCGSCYREIRLSLLGVLQTQKQLSFSFENAMNSNAVTAVGSIAARVVAIAVMAAATIALPTLLIQTFSTDWETVMASFFTVISGGGGGGAEGQTIFAWIQRVIPLPTMISAAVTYVLFELALMFPQTVWQFIFRFMPV